MDNAGTDIATLLQTNLFGTIGTDLFINSAPDPPDNMILVNDTSGLPPIDAMGDGGSSFEIPGIQIQVRNDSNSTAITTMWNIFYLLHKYNGTINSANYLLILASQNPFLLYKDENERFVYACNFLAKRRPVQ